MNGEVRNSEADGFSPAVWHALVSALLLALITMAGCNSDGSGSGSGGGAAAMGPVARAQAAPSVSATSPLARAPQAVRDSFFKDHRRDDQLPTVTNVKHRLMPDQHIHYTLTSIDAKGNRIVEEYRDDGLRITPKPEE